MCTSNSMSRCCSPPLEHNLRQSTISRKYMMYSKIVFRTVLDPRMWNVVFNHSAITTIIYIYYNAMCDCCFGSFNSHKFINPITLTVIWSIVFKLLSNKLFQIDWTIACLICLQCTRSTDWSIKLNFNHTDAVLVDQLTSSLRSHIFRDYKSYLYCFLSDNTYTHKHTLRTKIETMCHSAIESDRASILGFTRTK